MREGLHSRVCRVNHLSRLKTRGSRPVASVDAIGQRPRTDDDIAMGRPLVRNFGNISASCSLLLHAIAEPLKDLTVVSMQSLGQNIPQLLPGSPCHPPCRGILDREGSSSQNFSDFLFPPSHVWPETLFPPFIHTHNPMIQPFRTRIGSSRARVRP